MKKYKSTVEIKLSFRSRNIDLNFISEILDLTPTNYYKIGDYIENYGNAKTFLWEYLYVKCNAYEELEHNLNLLINSLLNKDFEKIKNNDKIDEKLCCIKIMKGKYEDIGLDLNAEEIEKLHILGIGLSLSIYDL
jgi:hypothetical protein